MKNILAIFFFYVLITLCILAFLSVQGGDRNIQNPNITFRVIDTAENTFGYAVFLDNKELIHQSSASVIDAGFKSREEAEKIALSVVDKLKMETRSVDQKEKYSFK
jgi:hypothetical protein